MVGVPLRILYAVFPKGLRRDIFVVRPYDGSSLRSCEQEIADVLQTAVARIPQKRLHVEDAGFARVEGHAKPVIRFRLDFCNLSQQLHVVVTSEAALSYRLRRHVLLFPSWPPALPGAAQSKSWPIRPASQGNYPKFGSKLSKKIKSSLNNFVSNSVEFPHEVRSFSPDIEKRMILNFGHYF